MSHARLWFAVSALSLVAACGVTKPPAARAIAAKDYSQQCATVADCLAVYLGPVGCCGGGCPNAAIRADALPKYTSDLDMAIHCHGDPPCPTTVQICATGRLECISGACQFEAPPPDASAAD